MLQIKCKIHVFQIAKGMAVSFSKVENYLSRIGLKCANVEFCHLEGKVPLSLSEYYEARVGNLLGSRYLFLMLTGERPNPDALIRQVVAVSRYYSERPIVLFGELDAEYYDRLCRENLAFIVPGRIVHIPPLVELKADNAFSASDTALGKYLSPWAQVIVLYQILNNRGNLSLPYSMVTEALRLNRVYLTRAAHELERRHLAKIEYSGIKGIITFAHDGRGLWHWAQDLLTSPVRKTIRTICPPANALRSGIAALSARSMLVPDRFATYAVVSSDLRKIPESDVREYEGDYVEGWKYDPRLLAGKDGIVDPLSLYLSLRNNADPRVEEACEAMLKGVLW